eukprot:CAMPEP_0175823124 /NCGR_PEP_ID=MMETSP0107_2-20121207/10042_1 /TAXON_ID=195067 ORGANISM="Goniomonas pacifica, Strain CCMP1869" /NCGR_SAMPLE_ID=MMETSP0107_2 /ASSEMBLY_ACC=CAM_ASM_000203 /LENGTH=69 /DNA_ID=CAMNT_0017135631 /DNA_START=434 /DNA_END=643 /DNA_ORIENTATION=-
MTTPGGEFLDDNATTCCRKDASPVTKRSLIRFKTLLSQFSAIDVASEPSICERSVKKLTVTPLDAAATA